MRPNQLGLIVIVLVVLAVPLRADNYETIFVDPGNTVDVYWSINLSGKLYVAADTNGTPACVDYWWIVWPFAQIKSLGRQCGRASFALPSLSDWALGGKLRAGGAAARTRIRATAEEQIAHRFPGLNF
jgi:hypothetical protein